MLLSPSAHRGTTTVSTTWQSVTAPLHFHFQLSLTDFDQSARVSCIQFAVENGSKYFDTNYFFFYIEYTCSKFSFVIADGGTTTS